MKLFVTAVAVVAMLALGAEALEKINLMMHLHKDAPIRELRSSRNLQVQFIDQRVDNFNPQHFATYQMVCARRLQINHTK